VDAALLELPSEERWLLASWYLDGRTLAEIARMMAVHESTISRRMEKITASLRKRIVRGLRERGMDSRAAQEAMEADVRDLALDVRGRLLQGKSG
jgi:RNA polymerase sigma-70 factor (ECF subfamily)